MRVKNLPLYTHTVFLDEPSGEYVAECPEIPGLSGIGETREEAIAALEDAIEGWLAVLEEDGLPFPRPFLDVKGDFTSAGARNFSVTISGTSYSSLQGSYPTFSVEQQKKQEKSQTGTSLHH